MIKQVLAIGIVSILSVTGAYAQSCVPGPKCVAADQAAQAAIAGWQPLLQKPSVHISSEVAYCTNMQVVETAKICENEFRESGDTACADISAQQAKESQSSADVALGSAAASAAMANWAPDCAAVGGDGAKADAGTGTATGGKLDMASAVKKMTGTWTASHTDGKAGHSWTIVLAIAADGTTTGTYSHLSTWPGLPDTKSDSAIEGKINLEDDAIYANITMGGQVYQSVIRDISGTPVVDDGYTFRPELTKSGG